MQYRQLLALLIPNIDALTVWTKDGDFYWPDPTKVHLWNGTSFAKNPNASVAELPDHFHWHKDYIENQPLLFVEI